MRYINRFFNWLGYYKPRAYRMYLKSGSNKQWIQVVLSHKNIDATCNFDEVCVYETKSLELEEEFKDPTKDKNLINWYRMGDSSMKGIIEPDLTSEEIMKKYGFDGMDESISIDDIK